MNLIYIIISFVLLVVVLESVKHLFTKSLFHFIMIGVLFLVVLFLVFEGLGTENNVMENNSFVMTGAAVIDVFKESDLFGDFSFESLNPIPALKNIFSNDDSGW